MVVAEESDFDSAGNRLFFFVFAHLEWVVAWLLIGSWIWVGERWQFSNVENQ